MSDALPTCPDCSQRPVPTSRSRRCLACAKKRPGGAWRQMIARYRNKHGEAAAREFAASQGVPYSPAASAADGKPKQKPGAPAPSVADPEGEPGEAVLETAPETIEQHEIGTLARRVEWLALTQTMQALEAKQITPGMLPQVAHMADKIAERYGEGTTATRIEVVFDDAA